MPPEHASRGRRAGAVVALTTARRAARSGLLWGFVFGLYVVASASGYAASFPTATSRIKLATSFGANAAGRAPKAPLRVPASLFLATCRVAGAALFRAGGLVVGQLAATRRQANGIAAAVLGLSYLLRMAADSNADLRWLRRVSPLGWVEELRPLVPPRPLALVPIVTL